MTATFRPSAADALRLAERRFLAPDRIDMSALADELGVNRVTLYRWFGSRDQFLVEVIWALARRTLDRVDAAVGEQGAERVVRVVVGFLDAVISNAGMQRWLSEEGEHAMRLLTRHETDFQPRLIRAIERLLEEEADAGRLDLPVDLRELAYVVVRLIESYTYLDLITGERPDARRAEPILRMLLRLDPHPGAGAPPPPARSRPAAPSPPGPPARPEGAVALGDQLPSLRQLGPSSGRGA